MTERLLKHGCTVLAVDSKAQGLDRIEGRTGVVPLRADVTKSDDLAGVRAAAEGMEPGRVAEVVVRALYARSPRVRYPVGNPPLRVLLGKLPASWADALIRWYCGTPGSAVVDSTADPAYRAGHDAT